MNTEKSTEETIKESEKEQCETGEFFKNGTVVHETQYNDVVFTPAYKGVNGLRIHKQVGTKSKYPVYTVAVWSDNRGEGQRAHLTQTDIEELIKVLQDLVR